MSKVYVAGFGYDCDARVVPWFAGPQYNAHVERCRFEQSLPKSPDGGALPYDPFIKNTTRTKRYGFRRRMKRPKVSARGIDPDREVLAGAQSVVRQCVVHFDNCKDSEMCFRVLQDERGLSCHFLLDWNGTIYQTLDLALKGAQAAGINDTSIGIELASWGNARKFGTYYDRYPEQLAVRDRTTVKVNGHVYLAWTYTDAQIRAIEELARTLRRALPGIALTYPQSTPGKQLWDPIGGAARDEDNLRYVRAFSGWCGHYHTTRRKWDPGPFDFKRLIDRVQGGLCFPVHSPDLDRRRPPKVPKDTDQLYTAAAKLHQMTNSGSPRRSFPVGPYGNANLWHGGAHLAADAGAPVYAPLPGQIVAARQGRHDTEVGSVNFVLMRHTLNMTKTSEAFELWSLYFHLADETKQNAATLPDWMLDPERSKRRKPVRRSMTHGATVLLDIPVAAGERIGRIGRAGPIDARKPQLHLAMFSRKDISRVLAPRRWSSLDGTPNGRFATTKALKLEPELRRSQAFLFQSEFNGTVAEWVQTLKGSNQFPGLDIEALVSEQIEPTLWWDRKAALHAGLPNDGVVYHYDPIALLQLINETLIVSGRAQSEIGAHDQTAVKPTPQGVSDEEKGDGMLTKKELVEDARHDLAIRQLVKGFVAD